MPNDPLKLTALMASALPAVDDPKWAEKMRQVITRGHLSAWMLGTAERLGVPPDSPLLSRQRLSRAEREEIKAIVARQIEYLRGFEKDKGAMSEAGISNRASLYPGALSTTYYATRWGDWQIPDQLLPGTAQCITRCKCSISVKDNGDGTGVLTRVMGGVETAHCSECPALAGDHPVKRRGA